MSRSTSIETSEAGAVVVKRATGADVPRLRAAADRLLGAAHPGVVEVLSSTGTDDAWELRLLHAGRPVERDGSLAPEQVAGVAAAVAATLADLHAAGIVHGRLDGSRVLVGAHGRPVLCGFGDQPVAGAEPADDVAALGALISSLLGPDTDGEPIPERRWRRRTASGSWARRSLLLLADQCGAEPPTRRPSARRLAAAIAEAVPGVATAAPAPEPARTDSLDVLRATGDDAPAGRARLRALLTAVAGVLVLGVGGVRLARPDPEPVSAGAPIAVAPATTASSTTMSSTTSTTTATTTTEAAVVEGTTVLVGGRRYEVGRPGDRVVVGDWDCDGSATAAVLRPATGEIFVFSAWAAAEEIVVPAIDRVPGAVALLVERGDDGCSVLVVHRADGTQASVAGAASA